MSTATSARPRRERRADGKRFYSPAQVSEITGIPTGTLAQWRHRGYLFPFHRLGSHILYPVDELERVLAENTIQPTLTHF